MAPPLGTPPPNKLDIDEVWLLEQARTRSSGDIAKDLGVDGRTVRRRLTGLGFDMSRNGSRFNEGVRRSPETEIGGSRGLPVGAPLGGLALKGKTYPPDHPSRRRGPAHPNWRGGIRKERNGYRDAEYKEWRLAVFTRDDYTCQICGERGGVIHADHIKRWIDYPESRFDVDNGRTLCAPCHRQTPTYGNRVQRRAGAWVGIV